MKILLNMYGFISLDCPIGPLLAHPIAVGAVPSVLPRGSSRKCVANPLPPVPNASKTSAHFPCGPTIPGSAGDSRAQCPNVCPTSLPSPELLEMRETKIFKLSRSRHLSKRKMPRFRRMARKKRPDLTRAVSASRAFPPNCAIWTARCWAFGSARSSLRKSTFSACNSQTNEMVMYFIWIDFSQLAIANFCHRVIPLGHGQSRQRCPKQILLFVGHINCSHVGTKSTLIARQMRTAWSHWLRWAEAILRRRC